MNILDTPFLESNNHLLLWVSLGIILVIIIIIIVLIVLYNIKYKTDQEEHSVPSVITPTPSVITPTPSVITPTPSIITPTPSIITPTPSVITPTPSIITPTPSVITPTPSVITPTPSPTHVHISTAETYQMVSNKIPESKTESLPMMVSNIIPVKTDEHSSKTTTHSTSNNFIPTTAVPSTGKLSDTLMSTVIKK